MAGRDPRLATAAQAKRLEHSPVAAWLVVALWVPYSALNTLFPGPALTYTLALLLAALALGLLLRSGDSAQTLSLQVAPPSRFGLLILLLMLVFVPGALLAGRVQPFSVLDDLVYAPISALSQELYFRAALLVALSRLGLGRARLAIVAQAALFALWHARAFLVVAPLLALGALLLTLVAGLLWGTQVSRDRTILWSFAEHTLFLMVQ